MSEEFSQPQPRERKLKLGKFTDHILFEDEHIIVFNKPWGISSLKERNNDNLNVLEWARRYVPGSILCHRLDKDTSGVMLIAKDEDTYKHVTLQFEKRTVDKIYHAIVEGAVHFDGLTVNIPIKDTGEKVKLNKEEGKRAVTIFQSLKVFRNYSLIECKILTGRRHQIRIHLASQNTRISGDLLYGAQLPYLSSFKKNFKESKWENADPIVDRMMLHAYSISFNDTNGARKSFIAPYPKDFEVLLKLLEKYS